MLKIAMPLGLGDKLNPPKFGVNYVAPSTNWNLEADLLKDYLEYCIDWRFDRMVLIGINLGDIIPKHSPEELMKMFVEQGILIVNELPKEDVMLTFDEWKATTKIYVQGRGYITLDEAVKLVADKW